MRSRRLRLGIVGVFVAASSIGLVAFLLRNGDEREKGGRQAVDTSVPADAELGFLVVDQELRVIFTEGAFSYVRLESANGRVVAARTIQDSRALIPLLRQPLPAGAYRFVSYQRPCEGACPRRGERGLGRPALRCNATIEIVASETVTALVRSGAGHGCRVLIGERVRPGLARRHSRAVCRATIGDGRPHGLRYWARNWGAASTRSRDLGAAHAAIVFRGFESSIRAAAAEGCAEGIRSVRQPIRFVLEGRLSVGETVEVSIRNVGTRAYLYEFSYQACFLSYFDSSGRRFIVPPGTHCDVLAKVAIRPGKTERLFTWRLDECVKDSWGCVRSRPLPPGTYTIKGRFKPAAGGPAVQAVRTFEIQPT
jgi:hypothetical protein